LAKLNGRLTIKQWPPELRPRERLIQNGAENLSNIELLAIIIGTGTRSETTLELSQRILTEFKSLGALGVSTLEELLEIDGIGEAKAAKVLASLELGKRLSRASPTVRRTIESPQDVVEVLMPGMRYLDREHFKALILNTKNQILRIVNVSVGSLNSSVVHPRELYKMVIRHNGAAVIVAHNHPSGDPTPSTEDIILTKRLIKAGRILGIELLDHIILGDGHFVSLKKKKLI
jgi:DNA repair protein RadC